jgi:hypothetical protein
MTSTITGFVMEDENVLKLDDHVFVRYHGAFIRKLKTKNNGEWEASRQSIIKVLERNWRVSFETGVLGGLPYKEVQCSCSLIQCTKMIQ